MVKWVDCTSCQGKGYIIVERRGIMRSNQCKPCKGTGKVVQK